MPIHGDNNTFNPLVGGGKRDPLEKYAPKPFIQTRPIKIVPKVQTKHKEWCKKLAQDSRVPVQRKSALRFTPLVYAKIMHLADKTSGEISGYGVSGVIDKTDAFLVSDFHVLKQVGTMVTTILDDGAIANYQEDMFEAGLQPNQCMRIWIHFHPGGSSPSSQDEETFRRIFINSDWGVMCIIARGQNAKHYARIRFNVGPGGSIEIPVEVDWSAPFGASDLAAWDAEFDKNVSIEQDPYLESEMDNDWPMNQFEDRGMEAEDAWGNPLKGQVTDVTDQR